MILILGITLGNTILMLAAYAGHSSLTRALLQRGADPNRLNDLGQSIIAGATFKGYTEVVEALFEKGRLQLPVLTSFEVLKTES